MAASERIRVFVVEDHAVVRQGLIALLSSAPEIEVVGFAKDGQEAVNHYASVMPDVTLMDLQMPVMDGWQFRREQMKDQRLAKVPVVVVTAFSAPQNIDAAAILQKPIDVEELLGVVRHYC